MNRNKTSVPNTKPFGVMFHHFHDSKHLKGQGAISSAQFSQIIEFVGRQRILPAKEWMARALLGALRDDDVCLTFDDSLRCQYDIAYPVLKHYGLTAFWFVYTSVMEGKFEKVEVYRHFRSSRFRRINDFYKQFLERAAHSGHGQRIRKSLEHFDSKDYGKGYAYYTDQDLIFRYVRDEVLGPEAYNSIMDAMLAAYNYDVKNEARDLWLDDSCLRKLDSKGHVIGLHSHSHPMKIADLSPAHQKAEYQANFEYLDNLLGAKPTTMSHPCNSYNSTTIRILRELGIRLGFSASMEKPRLRSEFDYPRMDHATILKIMQSP